MLKHIILLSAIITQVSGMKDFVYNNDCKNCCENNIEKKSLNKRFKVSELGKKELANIELLMLKEVIKYTNDDNYSIKKSKVITDFNNNPFVLVEFNVGYAIYCVSTGEFTEIAPFAESPYSKVNDDTELKYVFMNGYYSYEKDLLTKLENGESKKNISDDEFSSLSEVSRKIFSSLENKINTENINYMINNTLDHGKTSVFRENEMLNTRSGGGTGTGTNNPTTTIIEADIEVPYSWYFKYNVDQFSANTSVNKKKQGICGYTAASMLLTYHEVFNSPGYFSKDEADKYINIANGTFGETVPEIIDSFPTSIWGTEIGNTTPGEIKSEISEFLQGKNVNYDVYCKLSVFSDIYKPIEDGVPAIYFGFVDMFKSESYGHAVLVYGTFDDGKLLCHWGWDDGGYSQVIMNNLDLLSEGGVYAIYNKSAHSHKAYFIDSNGRKRCGCGVFMSC